MIRPMSSDHGARLASCRVPPWIKPLSRVSRDSIRSSASFVAVISSLVSRFNMFIGMLREKYAHFGGLPPPEPFRHIVRADELWLVTLTMSAIGLLTAVKWDSVFPGLRDYQSLGTLPLRPWQIFAAKLSALLIVP